MTTPPLLLAAALAFWGWHTGLLLPGLILGATLEAARLSRWRWTFSREDFDRISHLTSLLSWGIAAYLFISLEAIRALNTLFQWFPLILAPLMLVQAYGTAERIDVTGLFWTLRRRHGAERPRRIVNLSHLYGAICLLAAAAANDRSPWFYPGVALLVGWALWGVRASRVPPARWAVLLLVVVGLGLGVHTGLRAGQKAMEAKLLEWIAEWIRRDTDPYRTSTALGAIGNVKLSERILLRVEGAAEAPPPALLHEASYNLFNSPSWIAYQAGFRPVLAEGDGSRWPLAPPPGAGRPVTISAYLRRGRGVLALPAGTFLLEQLPAAGLSRNGLGAVRVEEGPGLVTYRAHAHPAVAGEEPATDLDLRVPAADAPVLTRVATELGLPGLPPPAARDRVARFFRERFAYSTWLGERRPGVSPLEEFLLHTRRGHCEYFATATALLLRAAGVPTRYATGYAVQEWSPLEGRWIVRARHAHAWARVWVDGHWQDLDTTPGTWVDAEAALASRWERLGDVTAWLGYVVARWRWSERSDLRRYLAWLVVPLVVLLVWRLSRSGQRTRRAAADRAARTGRVWPGHDSEFYAIERRVGELGVPRQPGEPPRAWLARIEATGRPAMATAPLRQLLSLHYRYRFDPVGLSATERMALREGAEEWLEQHRELTAAR